jgi:hypothetical protein
MPDGSNLPANLLSPDPVAGSAVGGGASAAAPSTPPADTVDHQKRAQDYVSRTMQLEGGGKDPNSSAVGGFVDKTWLTLMHQTLPQTQQMPDAQVLAYRQDPVLRSKMVAAYAADNAPLLKMAGQEPDETNLRLAHWLGPAGAVRVLHADPNTPIDKLFSQDVIAANPALKGKTAGELVSYTNQQMTGATLAQQWNGSISPEAQALIGDIRSKAETNHTENMRMISAYEQEAAKAPEGSAQRQQALDDMRRVSHQMLQDWEKFATHPPVQKPMDMWQNLGSMSTIIAALGGLFTRNHMTAGLSAAGEAMKAINTNNADQYQQAYKRWEEQTSLGIKMVDLQNQEITQLLTDSNLAQSEKQARLNTLANEYGMLWKDQAGSAGADEKVLGYVAAADRASASAKNMVDMIKVQNYSATVAAGKQAWVSKNPGKTEADIPAEVVAQINTSAMASSGLTPAASALAPAKAKAAAESNDAVSEKDAAWLKDHPEANGNVPADIHAANIGAVHREMSGSQPRSALAMATAKYLQENPTATAEQIAGFNAEYQRLASTARDFVSGPDGKTVVALNTVADHLPLFRQYAAALQNGDLSVANSVLNKIQRQTGRSDITNFELARDFLADEVSRVLVPGGVGSTADREQMKSRLEANMSEEQLAGGADTATAFIRGKLEAERQNYARGDAKSVDYFNQHILTDGARSLFEGGGGAGNATLPAGLPPTTGLRDGTQAKDSSGKVVAIVHDGKWATP